MTYDGSNYHILLESDVDRTGGAVGTELALFSYASVADIVTDTLSGSGFADKGVFAAYSTRGLAYDGASYHVLFETDEELTGPAQDKELAIGSYASISDLLDSELASLVFTEKGVISGYSITGMTDAPVPEPSAALLFAVGLGVVSYARRSS